MHKHKVCNAKFVQKNIKIKKEGINRRLSWFKLVSPPLAIIVTRHFPNLVCIDFPGTWNLSTFCREELKTKIYPIHHKAFAGVFYGSPACFVRLHNFWRIKKNKFILKIFLTKVKHYCMKLNYSSTVKSKSPGTRWLELKWEKNWDEIFVF